MVGRKVKKNGSQRFAAKACAILCIWR